MRLLTAVSALLVAGLAAASPVRADPLVVPPAGYTYAATQGCPFDGVAYHACEDQMQLFATAMAAAKSQDKVLLVVLGADWCPWCRALDKMLPTDKVLGHKDEKFDFSARYAIVNIAVSASAKGKRVRVPSGEAVADLVMAQAKAKRPNGIPYFMIVEPKSGGVIHRKTDDLEDPFDNKSSGHDPEKLREALKDAYAQLRQ